MVERFPRLAGCEDCSDDTAAPEMLQLSVRSRVVLVLLALGHVRDRFQPARRVAARVQAAADLAWDWEQSGAVEARKLYSALDVLNEIVMNLRMEESDPMVVALRAAVFGFYYITWEAVKLEAVSRGKKHLSSFNGLSDVSEEHVTHCLAQAAEAAADPEAERKWQQDLTARLLARQGALSSDSLGAVLPREDAEKLAVPA